MGTVDEHDPNPRPEEREDPARLLPAGAEQQEYEIPANEGKVCPQPHADERQGGQRPQEISLVTRGVVGYPA